jgi:hypothetical protein
MRKRLNIDLISAQNFASIDFSKACQMRTRSCERTVDMIDMTKEDQRRPAIDFGAV